MVFERWRKPKEQLQFPIKINTEDGHVEINIRRECCDIEIKRVHVKGKSWYPKVKFVMGLSDVQFIHGSGINKKTWVSKICIPTSIPNVAQKLLNILEQMKKEKLI